MELAIACRNAPPHFAMAPCPCWCQQQHVGGHKGEPCGASDTLHAPSTIPRSHALLQLQHQATTVCKAIECCAPAAPLRGLAAPGMTQFTKQQQVRGRGRLCCRASGVVGDGPPLPPRCRRHDSSLLSRPVNCRTAGTPRVWQAHESPAAARGCSSSGGSGRGRPAQCSGPGGGELLCFAGADVGGAVGQRRQSSGRGESSVDKRTERWRHSPVTQGRPESRGQQSTVQPCQFQQSQPWARDRQQNHADAGPSKHG